MSLFGDRSRSGLAQHMYSLPFIRFYEECSDIRRVVRQLSFYQDEYNLGGKGAEMSLVFFPDAVRHVLRIARILTQPRGNAILIGLAGEWKSKTFRRGWTSRVYCRGVCWYAVRI